MPKYRVKNVVEGHATKIVFAKNSTEAKRKCLKKLKNTNTTRRRQLTKWLSAKRVK